jgi:hypothetical protein
MFQIDLQDFIKEDLNPSGMIFPGHERINAGNFVNWKFSIIKSFLFKNWYFLISKPFFFFFF